MPSASSVWLPLLATASLMAREVHRAGVAVDQRDAVEEEARGEGAEEEVLHRRLLAQQPAPPREAAQQVERQRQHLEGDEHREQVTGRGEEHHAADREQQQRVDLGVVEAGGGALGVGARERGGLAGEHRHPALDLALGEQQDAPDGEDQDQSPQEQRRTVERDRALRAEQATRRTVTQRGEVGRHHADPEQGQDQRAQGDRDLREVAPLARQERLDDHPDAGGAEHHQDRPQRAVDDARLGERRVGEGDHCCPPWAEAWTGTVGAGSWTPTCCNVSWT